MCVCVRMCLCVWSRMAVREGDGKVPGKQRRFQAAWISLRAAEQTVPWGPQVRLGVKVGPEGRGWWGSPRDVSRMCELRV